MEKVSGFDPLFAEIESKPGIESQSVWVSDRPAQPSLAKRILSKVSVSSPPSLAALSPFQHDYHDRAVLELLRKDRAWGKARANHEATLFLSAGESQFVPRLANADRALKQRLVVCFHQPPSWWRLHWRSNEALRDIGTIVCLCEMQKEYFESITASPIVKIRHGVRYNFFTPAEEPHPTKRLVFVGKWLRDFDCLERTLDLLFSTSDELSIDCVVPIQVRRNDAIQRLARCPRIRWHAGLSASELRNLYQSADVLLLPLIDAAANNAIVEALSCGLPIVSTDVGGIREYVSDEFAILCAPGDANAHAAGVMHWLQNDSKRGTARIAARRFAESFLDWEKIAEGLLATCHSM